MVRTVWEQTEEEDVAADEPESLEEKDACGKRGSASEHPCK